MSDFAKLGIGALLKHYPGLRLIPSPDDSISIAGRLRFSATNKGFEPIEDNYEIAISVPPRFPRDVPLVWETGGRIPTNFHRNPEGELCLGSPTAMRLKTLEAGSMDSFVNMLVIPYLYQHSYFKAHNRMPLGELEHGLPGVLRDLVDLFGVQDGAAAVSMVRLASLRKRTANRRPCPCGGKRLGRCPHHKTVNILRKKLGRSWFRKQFIQILEWQQFRPPGHPKLKDEI